MRENVSISLDENLKAEVDKWAEKTNNTRSGFVQDAVREIIKQYSAIEAIQEFNAICKASATQGGTLTEQQLQDLYRIQQCCDLLGGVK